MMTWVIILALPTGILAQEAWKDQAAVITQVQWRLLWELGRLSP